MAYVFIIFQGISVQVFVESLDGDTTGPTSLLGENGKKLIDFEKSPIANFESILFND